MKEKEILAYAITHAPKGVKGGPYEGLGDYGSPASSLRHAERWKAPLSPYSYTLARVRQVHPHARAIRIVRKARPFKETIPVCGTCGYDAHGGRDEEGEPAPSPSEASAVEVLRELVAAFDRWNDDTLPVSRLITACDSVEVAARRVLAASGPDPMPVVRAAMRETEAWDAYLAAPATRSRAETEVLDNASRKRFAAVDAYRKAGGK